MQSRSASSPFPAILLGCSLVLAALSQLGNPIPARASPPALPDAARQLGITAYIQGGDIWVKELPDGEPRRLTTDGENRSPRWSSSGKWLAFYKGSAPSVLLPSLEQLWVMSQSGDRERMIDAGGTPEPFAWSSISDDLAFANPAGDLRVASAPDWQPRVLVAGSTGNGVPAVESLAWSPDGKRLAFGRQKALAPLQPNQPPKLEVGLWTISADGGNPTQIFDGGAPARDGIIAAGWSRDGRQILVWPDPVFSASLLADGVPLQAISISGGKPYTLTDAMLLHSDWIDTSNQGLLAVTEGGDRESWTNKHIVVVDPVTGNSAPLTDDKTAASSPAWSPDGQRIAYVAAPDIGAVGGGNEAKAGAAKRRIWVMNRDGSNMHQLTNDPVYRDERPLWLADGRSLLFARLDNVTDKISLWTVPIQGGQPSLVSADLDPLPSESTWFGYYGHIDWGDYFALWTPSTTFPLPTTGREPSSQLALLVFSVLTLLLGVWMFVRADALL